MKEGRRYVHMTIEGRGTENDTAVVLKFARQEGCRAGGRGRGGAGGNRRGVALSLLEKQLRTRQVAHITRYARHRNSLTNRRGHSRH